MSKQAYKFRLYPTRKQRECLQKTLDACRNLYNAALQERKDAYDFHVRRHPSYYDAETRKQRSRELEINYCSQANQLPEIKDIREEYQDVHSQVLQDVLRRVQKAFDAFFRRVKNGEEPGYLCLYKAEEAGRIVLFVNPKYTSQICSGCGTVVKKD